MSRKKSVSLTFRGFDCTAQEVAILIDSPPSRLGNRGEPVRSGVKTLLTRSYVLYSMNFLDDYELCDMLLKFLGDLGGVEHLCQVQRKVQPEFSEFHFDLPVKESDESQEGYFSTKDIADIFQLRASISLGFF
ncbi:hypothetical protein [Massilia pseudoviolaceinigra]|uniref:hypothetical protein n=1 Tax=Massilia pseudoviolaceinigra TaxID=3057165 RepID=UPI002796A0EA|nr:hypothetical protein [Massilia sp. CCM 9206]MDQ1925167.1 hypothetical protein [Massilia sp. CCM 9206]